MLKLKFSRDATLNILQTTKWDKEDEIMVNWSEWGREEVEEEEKGDVDSGGRLCTLTVYVRFQDLLCFFQWVWNANKEFLLCEISHFLLPQTSSSTSETLRVSSTERLISISALLKYILNVIINERWIFQKESVVIDVFLI